MLRNMQKIPTILSAQVAQDRLAQGEIESHQRILRRRMHIRTALLYGYDHPTTVRYRQLMHRSNQA